MRIGIMTAVVVAGMLAGGSALADDVNSGIEVGGRVGYAIPLGSLAGGGGTGANTDVSNFVSGALPLWLDAGYRFASPNLFVGGYLSWGPGFNGSGLNNCSCSTNLVQYGLQAHYHFLPDQSIDPWVGYGIGMESLNLSAQNGGQSISGWDYAVFQVGADYRALLDNLGVGPVVNFGIGQYNNLSTSAGGQSTSASIPNQALHEWLTIGIRGVYDIKI